MKKVGIILGSEPGAGVFQYTQSILDALKSAGIDPNVVVAPSAGGDAQ